MKYKIVDNPAYTSVMLIGVELEPEKNNEPLKFFFTSMRLRSYPTLLRDVCNDRGYYGDPQGVIFYSDLDEEDFANNDNFPEDQVNVYHHVFGECLVSKSIFKGMLYDFSSRLLSVYRNDKSLPDSWSIDLRKNLDILDKQIGKSTR